MTSLFPLWFHKETIHFHLTGTERMAAKAAKSSHLCQHLNITENLAQYLREDEIMGVARMACQILARVYLLAVRIQTAVMTTYFIK